MDQIPIYVSLFFILITILVTIIFYRATDRNTTVLFSILVWVGFLSLLSINGFFTVTDSVPPRFLLMVMPPLIATIVLFATKKGRSFLERMDIRTLTWLHAIRILVEIGLYLLFVHQMMPLLMTFEGRNYDIFSGLSALVMYYFVFIKRKLGAKTLLAWNLLCLGILISTVTHAVLSAPGPLQQFGFDQPNRAVLYFPFVFLPGLIVPIVYFSHLVAIRRLWKEVRSKAATSLLASA